jgi:hypothetical protein
MNCSARRATAGRVSANLSSLISTMQVVSMETCSASVTKSLRLCLACLSIVCVELQEPCYYLNLKSPATVRHPISYRQQLETLSGASVRASCSWIRLHCTARHGLRSLLCNSRTLQACSQPARRDQQTAGGVGHHTHGHTGTRRSPQRIRRPDRFWRDRIG